MVGIGLLCVVVTSKLSSISDLGCDASNFKIEILWGRRTRISRNWGKFRQRETFYGEDSGPSKKEKIVATVQRDSVSIQSNIP